MKIFDAVYKFWKKIPYWGQAVVITCCFIALFFGIIALVSLG